MFVLSERKPKKLINFFKKFSKEFLIQEHVTNKLSIREIAKKYNISYFSLISLKKKSRNMIKLRIIL